MDKKSIYLLQKIDCNCNDCRFMHRDFEAYKKWENWHRELQLADFILKKNTAMAEAKGCADPKGRSTLLALANKMQFQFDKSGIIQRGNCLKFQKPVTFIPGTCQLETQNCFLHRKDQNEAASNKSTSPIGY